MSNTIGPAPVDLDATQHLLDALRAQCLGDTNAFATAFADIQRGWAQDPLGALASTTLVSALAAKQVLDPARPIMVPLAYTLGRVSEQSVPDDLKTIAIEVVFRFAQGAGPNFIDAFGTDPVTWRQAGAAMAAFTTGLILADALERDSTPGNTMDRIFGPLFGTP